ncbi:unnamed protein product [Clonostachys solani]|uniref:Uncharacterized protein n=1 Tax=Clonostachys solani TaxID=160281 RepID=A0A9P0EI89_9HYPO|nr:unnamed protein product [Clonostachys solani]
MAQREEGGGVVCEEGLEGRAEAFVFENDEHDNIAGAIAFNHYLPSATAPCPPSYTENRQNKINREEVKMKCSGRVDDTGVPSPLYASPPGLVEKDGANTDNEKHATNRPADDVEIVADSFNAVPEWALWLCNVLDKSQDLDGTDECRHKDGDRGEDTGVV